jgi:autotransporter-associated beta strand protein
MAQYNRANTATNLNLTGAWVEGVVPTSVDIAAWGTPNISTGTAQALGGAVSWQGILLQSAQSTNITIGTTTAALTLRESGIDLSAASANLTIASPVTITLAANQSWSVAAGRTLSVSSAIAGAAKNVTLNGSGVKTLSGTSTGWTGSAVTVSAGQVNANNINALGAATNIVVVESGANLTVTANNFSPTTITINGAGFTGGTGYGAFTTTDNLASSNTITFGATNTVLSVRATTFAPRLAASVGVTSVTLNMNGNGIETFFNFASTYSVSNGVRLQSIATNGTQTNTNLSYYSFGDGSNVTDANSSAGGGFGNSANKVIVEDTGALIYSGSAATLSRAYTFIGRTRSTRTQLRVSNTQGRINLNGTVELSGTASDYVLFTGANSYNSRIELSGTLIGDANLDCGGWGSMTQDARAIIGPALNSSEWTGKLSVNSIDYAADITNEITYDNTTTINIDNITAGSLTVNHAKYTRASGSGMTYIGSTGQNLTLATGNWVSAPGTWITTAGTLTLNLNLTGAGAFTKQGAATLVLSGNNTGLTTLAVSAGALVLNSAGSAGPSAATFTFVVGASLDSTTGATLDQNGLINTGAAAGSWTWVGTNDLTFGTGNVTLGGDRTITHGATGGEGTLKFRGGITTSTATFFWNFGGSRAGAKQRVTLVGANASLVAATAADQHSVTAGYFRIENNNGLGAAGTTTSWWVGATNLGVQTTKAALELAGVTTPDTKSVNLYNIGPNDDGALIGASGTSVFRGGILIPNVAGTRFGAKAGATLTLDFGFHTVINAANVDTPLSFVAETGGQINVDRVLGGPTSGGSNIGAVTVTGGSGTVVLSRANLHTGATTCSAGTTKVTHINATSTGSVFVPAGATLESTVQSQFQSTLSLGTTSSLSRAILKFAA